MSARKYDVLTRLCFLAAIVSSVVYGRLGALDWLALIVGVVSAIVAVSTYFSNAHGLEKEEKAELADNKPACEKTEVLASVEASPAIGALFASASEEFVAIGAKEVQTTLWENVLRANLIRRRHHEHYVVLLEYYKQVQEVSRQTAELRERQQFLDEVVQLVDRFSSTCEIEVSLADRHLTIRPSRPTRPAHLKTREDRLEADLGQQKTSASELIN